MTEEDAPAEVINLEQAWELAVEVGLDGCFPSDQKSFEGWETYFNRRAERCGGSRYGEVRLELARVSTGKRELWSADLRRLDEPNFVGYGNPFAYIITGFRRIDR